MTDASIANTTLVQNVARSKYRDHYAARYAQPRPWEAFVADAMQQVHARRGDFRYDEVVRMGPEKRNDRAKPRPRKVERVDG